MVDGPFIEDPKNLTFSKEALISGEGLPEKFRGMAITGTSIVMQIEGRSISKENISP